MEFPHFDVIRKYLEEEFPGLSIEDKDDFDLHAHRFKVIDEDISYLLKVSIFYAQDTEAETIKKLLHDERIASHMRNPEFEYVLISNDGVVPRAR